MKLTRIKASNFEGQTFEMSLSPLTVIVGGNFTGKTTRTNAIRFLLLGYLPELGSTNKASFALASGRQMTVEGIFDTGEAITRTMWLEGDSVRSKVSMPKELEGAPLAVMLDHTEYFKLSANKRMAYVASIFPNSTYKAGLSDETSNFLSGEMGMTVGQILDLDGAIAKVSDYSKAQKALADQMQKTIQGLSIHRAMDEKKSPIETVRHQRHELANKLVVLRVNVERLEDEREALEKLATRRRELTTNLSKVEEARAKRAGFATELTSLKNQLEELGDVDTSAATLQLDGAQRRLFDAKAKIETANAAVAKAKKGLDDLALTEICPWCGAKGTGWRDLKAKALSDDTLAAETIKLAMEPQIPVLESAVREANEGLTAAKARAEKAKALTEQVKEMEKKIVIWDKALANVPLWEAELTTMRPENPELAMQIGRAKQLRDVAEEQLKALDATLDAEAAETRDRQRLAQSEEERDKAIANVAKAKAAMEELLEHQKKRIAAVFEPLLVIANRLAGRVLRSPLAYHDGEIGRWEGSHFITHATFSGTEKAVTYAAIQIALAESSPVKIAIIDELARLDDKSLAELIHTMERETNAHLLDQFIGIDTKERHAYARCHVTEVKRE